MGVHDAELLFELDQDPEVMKYINGGSPTSRQDIDNVMIPRMMRYRNPEKGWGIWKVLLSEDQQFIGWILVRPMGFFSETPDWENLELGWRFKRETWGKGYATEAAAAIAAAFSTKADVATLSAIAVPENTASIAVMEKLGMRYLKTDLHRDPLGDAEVVYYAKPV
nr:GNAT family N-acetyltransferase [Simiduia aestuariiviva]